MTKVNGTPRHITIPEGVDRPALEAVLSDRSGAPAIVAPPHPRYGGSIEVPVVQAVFRALVDGGTMPLAFNWRGVGASEGRVSDELDDAVEDYAAACDFVAGADRRLLAAGYSWGAAAALRVAAARVDVSRLVLVAPPLTMIPTLPIREVRHPMLILVGSADCYAPYEQLQKLVAGNGSARLEVIDGADHFFALDGVAQVEARIAAYL